MAIIINGSGITSANIADGTITAADLANTYLTPTGDGSSLTNMAAGGKVLQVVSSVDTTVQGASASLVTGSSISITPMSTSSKILILFDLSIETAGSTSDRGIHIKVRRNGVDKITQNYEMYNSADISQKIGRRMYTLLDSPATTSSVSYDYTCSPTTGTVRINNYGKSTLTLMEISG